MGADRIPGRRASEAPKERDQAVCWSQSIGQETTFEQFEVSRGSLVQLLGIPDTTHRTGVRTDGPRSINVRVTGALTKVWQGLNRIRDLEETIPLFRRCSRLASAV